MKPSSEEDSARNPKIEMPDTYAVPYLVYLDDACHTSHAPRTLQVSVAPQSRCTRAFCVKRARTVQQGKQTWRYDGVLGRLNDFCLRIDDQEFNTFTPRA